jgi:hypothetical protein
MTTYYILMIKGKSYKGGGERRVSLTGISLKKKGGKNHG